MPFDLEQVIPVRERPDGLLEKDTFDLSTAVPVEENIPDISIDRNARYSPPLGEEEKAQAVVELSYKESGKKVPIGLQADWILTSKPAKLITTNVLGGILTGGIIPLYNAAKGLADASSPNSDIGKMMFDSVYKGLAENEKVQNLGGAAAKAYPEAPWQLTGAVGALAEVMMFMPTVVRGAAEFLSKDKQFTIALNNARQSPKWGDLVAQVSKKANQPIEVVDQQLYNKLWELRAESNPFKVLGTNLKKATGIDIFSEAGSIPLKRAKIGQVVNYEANGIIQTGKITELIGERAIIQLGKSEVVATLSQLSLPPVEAPKVSTEGLETPTKGIVEPTEGKVIKAYHGSPIEGLEEIGFGKGVRSNPFLGKSKEMESVAIFFSPDKKTAQFFAENRVEWLKSMGKEGKATVYERYLNIKKPADLSTPEKADEVLDELRISAEREIAGIEPNYGLGASIPDLIDTEQMELGDLYRLFDDKKIVDIFKKAGYDGAIIQEKKVGGISYAIFNPKQALLSPTGEGQKPPVEPPKTAVSGSPEEEPRIQGKTRAIINKVIGVAKPSEQISMSERTLLKERLRNIARGAKEGSIQTKEEIKTAQEDLIRMINDSDIEAKDKAKFLSTLKNIQSKEQLERESGNIIKRIEKYLESTEKREIKSKIKRELEGVKPIKQGFKTVGKFDYTTNKEFEDIRRVDKLNQIDAQAELESLPTENLTYPELVKARLLSLKANGASASLELHNQVLNDVLAMKQAGLEAKDEADFIKRMLRAEAIDEVSAGLDKIKGDKDSLLTKLENIYREGFSNTYSMLNSIAGKDIAAKYDPEPAENNREIAIYTKMKEVIDGVTDILGIDKPSALPSVLAQLAGEEFILTDLEGLKTDISKLEVLDIYNSIKNDLVRDRYYNAFGQEQVDMIVSKLTLQEKEMADYMQEVVQSYRDILNQRNIELTGRDLGEVENYWPASSEFEQSVTDDIRVQGETPSAMKERAKSSRVIPIPKNAWYKMQKHISQGEHTQYLSRNYETLKRIFQDRKVKNQISNKFGEGVYNVVMAHIDTISLNKQTERLDAVSKVAGKIINNWVKAKVAVNPAVFAKQLISVINYSENMPVGQWGAGFFKGLANPKKTFDFMWNNSSSFLEARFNRGYSEALQEALKGSSEIIKNQSQWAKGLTAFVRTGDISAIIYGGYPLVMSEMAKGKSIEEAFNIFRASTLKSQQSGASSGLSQFQRSTNPFTRILLAFKNTANQYFRKQMDAIISYKNKEMPAGQLAKNTIIYSILNPLLYALVGYGVNEGRKALGEKLGAKRKKKEPTDDTLMSSMIMQLAVNPFQAIPLVDDIAEFAMRKAFGKKVFGVVSTPVIDDITRAIQKLGKKEVTLLDWMQSLGTLGEIGTGLPVQTTLRWWEDLFVGEQTKKKKKY